MRETGESPENETFEPGDPDFARRVRESFDNQALMHTIGAELARVEAGYCELHLPYREDLCQQHGFLHAGITSTLADTSGGYAAYTLMPPDSSVLTVEYKINLLRPAAGERFIARATVKRPGRNLTVVEAEVSAVDRGEEKPIATMLATMSAVYGIPDRVAGG